MTGQEGKTASQLQIDIQANVFVCCEKWCGRDSDHCASLPPSLPPVVFFLSSSFFPPPRLLNALNQPKTIHSSTVELCGGGADFPKAIPHLLYFAVSMATGHFLHRNVPSIVSRIGGKAIAFGAVLKHEV